MKVYRVGGCVRDQIMGLEPRDIDYVVTGVTVEEMLDLGYSRVGADFPVFLHPDTGDEYALARTEVKVGSGYTGFKTCFDPSITIEQDLYRRDLTINAIASVTREAAFGQLIDPYNGVEDIKNKILRAVNPDAFIEDPVRILRLARFAARFPDFTIDPRTLDLCRQVTHSSEWLTLTSERVGVELNKALRETQPSRFFRVLREVNGLKPYFKEVDALIGQTQPEQWHPEGDSFEHTMQVVDVATEDCGGEDIILMALVHDFGKGLTRKEDLPKHIGHERAGVPLTRDFCERMHISTNLTNSALFVTEFHMHVHKAFELNPKTFVKVYDRLDRNTAIGHIKRLMLLAPCDARGRGPENRYIEYPQASLFYTVMYAIHRVTLGSLLSPEEIEQLSIERRKQILYKARIKAAQEAKISYIENAQLERLK